MRKIYKIGSTVTANDAYTGMIIEISLRMNTILYRLQQTTDDGTTTEWFEDWEITSTYTETEILRECLNTVDYNDGKLDNVTK